MIRAGIFIGVDKTGNLQKLNDAANGAKRMFNWALAQGIPEENLKLITDEDSRKVTIDTIYTAIEEIINGAGVDQLIIYFAGHGIYNNYSERWLLSNAPTRTGEAINVHGSVELARYCGIKHVVFISDACRMAADGIQALNVHGSEIFPNESAGSSNTVDQFFACSRGKAAIEYKDSNVAATEYTALYTKALLDALSGKYQELLEPGDGADTYYYLRPPLLEKYLRSELPRRIKALNLQNTVIQSPDSIVMTGGSWLARLGDLPFGFNDTPYVFTRTQNIPKELTRSAINLQLTDFDQQLEQAKTDTNQQATVLAENVAQLRKPFGPDHFETQCGFKVHGATITEFYSRDLLGDLYNDDVIRFYPIGHWGAKNVLLRFKGDFGTVIPAIPGYIAALTFENDELINVAYEPSANTPLWEYYQQELNSIRTLRAIAASSSKYSRFILDRNDAHSIAQRMQYEKLIDPTLSIYAAYAYHDLQEIDRISRMGSYQSSSLKFEFFDLALLSRQLVNKTISASNNTILPFTPLLAQGWSLIRANRITLPPVLDGLEDNLLNSLWSLYDSAGLEKLKLAMNL